MIGGLDASSRVLRALLLVLASGCSSTGVGNPGAGSLSLAIVSDDEVDEGEAPLSDAGAALEGGAAAGAPAPGEALPRGSLRRALLVFGELRWLPCAAALEPVRVAGPFVVDLLAGETRPELPDVAVPPGGFCGFDAPLAPARASTILGRSLWFSGVRADGVEFLLFANVRATLRVRAPEGQAWGAQAGESAALLWALRPRRWATQRELAEAEPELGTEGRRTIVIDANRHPLLFALIRARLASQSGVFRDRDDNGVLDAAERSEGELGSASTDAEE